MKGSSFIFYASFHEATKELNDAEYGALMRAINEYALNDVISELKGTLKMAFLLIKPQIDANMERRENGKNGGRPKKETSKDTPKTTPAESEDNNPDSNYADIPDDYYIEENDSSDKPMVFEAESPDSNNQETSKTIGYQNPKNKKPMVFENHEIEKPNVNVNVNGNVNVNENEKESSPPRSGGRSPEPQSAPHPKKTDSEPTRLAELLFTLHKKYDRQYSPPRKHIETWAEDIEKLHKIDKREYADIERVIRWVKTDGNFWFSNIMSGAKLREQFSRLCVQMSQGNTNRQGRGSAVDKSGVDKVDIDDVDIPF
ncbi:MAG: DUF6291 domain-containing protein [Treponema sp.]